MFKEKLNYLKNEVKIEDPSVDFFLGTINGNLDEVEDALDKGANVNITDKELLDRYSKELECFAVQKN